MSDPRKNFECGICLEVINDSQRQHGKETKCQKCLEIASEFFLGASTEFLAEKYKLTFLRVEQAIRVNCKHWNDE